MNTNQIYIKHLFILKWILVLIGITSIAMCVKVSTGSINGKNNSNEKGNINGNSQFILKSVDSIESKEVKILNDIIINILNK